jgi:hypothetical protein
MMFVVWQKIYYDASRRCSGSIFLLIITCTLTHCHPGQADPRLATPERTIATLLEASGVGLPLGGAPPEAPLRSQRQRRFHDIDTVALCFWDYDRDDPAVRAMGNFVVGMLAARLGHLVFNENGRVATVQAGRRTVFLRHEALGWQLRLRDSVPHDVQETLRRRPPLLPRPRQDLP